MTPERSMNTVMSSQNHAMKTNTVKTSTKKLRKKNLRRRTALERREEAARGQIFLEQDD